MLDEKDIERLDEIFVRKDDCNLINKGLENKINNDNIRLSVIENQLKLILAVLGCIGAGIASMLIKMFFLS